MSFWRRGRLSYSWNADPFTIRDRDVEWLLTLQPGGIGVRNIPPSPNAARTGQLSDAEQRDPSLRVSLEEFRKLASAEAVAIVDVRDGDSFAAGHIPGAISIPLDKVGDAVEQLRRFGTPVVTYCS